MRSIFNSSLKLLSFLIYQIRPLMRIAMLIKWQNNNYAMPAPHFIKQKVLLRNVIKNAITIETGTNSGDTAKILSKYSTIVYTLEPSKKLYKLAEKNLRKSKNIILVNKTSEEYLGGLLKTLKGKVNIWLDGHYSGGETYKGKIDTPIIHELKQIELNLNNFESIVILIDDVRLFEEIPNNSGYPSRSYLVNWANKHNLDWKIELDIFIARTK